MTSEALKKLFISDAVDRFAATHAKLPEHAP